MPRGGRRAKKVHSYANPPEQPWNDKAWDDGITNVEHILGLIRGLEGNVSTELLKTTKPAMEVGLSDRTSLQYDSCFRGFIRWCNSQALSPPFGPLQCYAYISARFEDGRDDVKDLKSRLKNRIIGLSLHSPSFSCGNTEQWQLFSNRCNEVDKSKNSPFKAKVIRPSDFRDFTGINSNPRCIAVLWVSTGMRKSGIRSLHGDGFPKVVDHSEYATHEWVHITIDSARVNLALNTVDERSIPGDMVPRASLLPLKEWWLDLMIVDALTRCARRRLGFDSNGVSDIADRTLFSYTGHSFRRTFAVEVRIWLEAQGVTGLDVKKPVLDQALLERWNCAGGWQPKSTEVFEYSADYKMHCPRNIFLVDTRILWWILNG